MKVKTLIRLLQEHDEDANVFLVCQPSYPFEYSIDGLASRSDFPKDEDDEEDEDGDEPKADDGTKPNDVFICEGTQVRYGVKAAWVAARGG